MDRRQLRQKLREHFGFHQFRPGQAEVVNAALEGRDILVLMPTGSGKSLCFQLPALELEGLTVVVSPLISLMKDQVDQLNGRGLAACEISSRLSATERRETEEAIVSGKAEFVYTTPEQMSVPEFRALLRQRPIDLFVVDEAHCASQWGHSFRPEYLALGEAISELGKPPVLALTATSTDEMIEDILTQLGIPDAEIVHTGFYRANLELAVLRAEGDDEKRQPLLDLLRGTSGSGIVYAATVKAVEALGAALQAEGLRAETYHGRLAAKRRSAAQDRFMQGETPIMVATNAFGLGIDKADIRFVIHYHLPGTIESFYQEFGRSGRDGEPAQCTLLFDPQDMQLHRFFQGGRYPDETELVNAYHAFSRLAEGGEPALWTELQAISPVPKSRLKVCLELFCNRRIARSEPGKRYRLLRPGLPREALAQAGQSYQERHERDLVRQQQMLEYADATCRWQHVLKYFGSDELPSGRCERCDRCR